MTWEDRVGAPGAPGAVADGAIRELVVILGESGGSGRATDAPIDYPAGYPPLDGSVWCMNDALVWRLVSEPVDAPGADYLCRDINDGGDGFGTPAEVGFAGFFGMFLQQYLGAGVEVGIVNCSKGSTTYADWAASGNSVSLYQNALYKVRAALATPNTRLHSIVIMQGINDAVAGSVTWDTAWSAIGSSFRADLSVLVSVLTRFVQMPPTEPTDTAYPAWGQLRTQQAGWVERAVVPYRVMSVSPDGDIDQGVHLSLASNIVLAERLMATFDPRVDIVGLQAAFQHRKGETRIDDGGTDTLDAWTDGFPPKAVLEDPYVLLAPSAGQRPAEAGLGWEFDPNDASQLADVDARMKTRFPSNIALTTHTVFTCGADNSGTRVIWEWYAGATEYIALAVVAGMLEYHRRTAAAGLQTLSLGAVSPSQELIASVVYDSVNATGYVDGVAVGGPTAMSAQPVDLGQFYLGGQSANFNGRITEHEFCLAAQTAPQAAAAVAILQAEWGLP